MQSLIRPPGPIDILEALLGDKLDPRSLIRDIELAQKVLRQIDITRRRYDNSIHTHAANAFAQIMDDSRKYGWENSIERQILCIHARWITLRDCDDPNSFSSLVDDLHRRAQYLTDKDSELLDGLELMRLRQQCVATFGSYHPDRSEDYWKNPGVVQNLLNIEKSAIRNLDRKSIYRDLSDGEGMLSTIEYMLASVYGLEKDTLSRSLIYLEAAKKIDEANSSNTEWLMTDLEREIDVHIRSAKFDEAEAALNRHASLQVRGEFSFPRRKKIGPN